ncbi:MAG: glutaredoxin family protein, partial [Candidatus Zixiibacteriota bacterium]
RFFSQKGLTYIERNVEKEQVRQEVTKKHGRMLTPTIEIREKVFFGFGINMKEIFKELGVTT